jgi:shikimate kinase
MAERESLIEARRKLVEGTEVLRTGGGTTLTSGECNALLDRIEYLEAKLAEYDKYVAEFTNRA